MTKQFLDEYLRTDEVLRIEKCSRTTLWRRIKAGLFPPPVEQFPHKFSRSDVASHQAKVRAAAGLPRHDDAVTERTSE